MASTPSEYNLVTLDELTSPVSPLGSSDLIYLLQYDANNSIYKENANKVTLQTLTNYITEPLGSASEYNAGTNSGEVLLIPENGKIPNNLINTGINAGEILLIPDNGKIPDNLISDTFATTISLDEHINNRQNPHNVNYGQALNSLQGEGVTLSNNWYGGSVIGPNNLWREDITRDNRVIQYGNYSLYITGSTSALYYSQGTPIGYFIRNGNLSIEGAPITIVAPTNVNHAATKGYVDNLINNSTISKKIVNVSGDTVIINPTNDGNDPLYLINHTSGTTRTISFDKTAFTSTDHYFNFILVVSNSSSDTLALTLNINSSTFNTNIIASKKAYINFMLMPASLGNQFILTHIYTV